MESLIRSHSLAAKIKSIREFIDQHRIASLIVAGIVGIMSIGGIAYALLRHPETPQPQAAAPTKKEKKPLYYSPLTGARLKSKKMVTKPITAIMIENSPDARPQSGLKDGEVVYEAIAEGGITRFLVLYQQHKPKLIGPVRSVRPYYIDWYTPYNASMAHVGGSAKGLRMIRNGSHRDLDQFFNPNTYWRASDRYAPHNVYTSFSKIDALNKKKHFTSSKAKPFQRTSQKQLKKPKATKVSVHISGPLFDSAYSYSKKHNNYVRSQAGALHKDREKGTITPKIVIAMYVNERTVQEETARESIKTTGKGKAVIFQNGDVIRGYWHRTSTKDQFTFTTTKGKDVALSRGQTWITAIPTSSGSVSWR